MEERFRRLDLDGDELIRQWAEIVTVDPNELTQFRRVCCRHCWGKDFGYQYTPGEFQKAKLRHEERRAELLGKSEGKSDIGEFPGVFGDWFDKRKDPNPDCPDCFGEGEGETFFSDTRRLSPAARRLFAGVKEGKDGIEILMKSQEKAMEILAKAWGMFKEKEVEININTTSRDDLDRLYAEKMRAARERQARIQAERQGFINGDTG